MCRESEIEFPSTYSASLNQLCSLCITYTFLRHTFQMLGVDDFRKCDSSEILLQEKMWNSLLPCQALTVIFTDWEISVSEEDVVSFFSHDQRNSTLFLPLNLGMSGKIPYRPKQVIFLLQKSVNIRRELCSRLLSWSASMGLFLMSNILRTIFFSQLLISWSAYWARVTAWSTYTFVCETNLAVLSFPYRPCFSSVCSVHVSFFLY
jgi:hypothetical protein